MSDIIFQFDDFSGPFDLLLDVIKRKELDIHDLPMSVITNDFIERTKLMPVLNTEESADFTAMASLLLKIKTEMLLPNQTSDPRANLVKELEEYERYKENLNKIAELQEIEQKFFKRTKRDVFKKNRKGSLSDVLDSYSSILKKKQLLERSSRLNELTKRLSDSKHTITDKMEYLKSIECPIPVYDMFERLTDIEETVVTFSALLELIKVQYFEVQIIEDKVYLVIKVIDLKEIENDE